MAMSYNGQGGFTVSHHYGNKPDWQFTIPLEVPEDAVPVGDLPVSLVRCLCRLQEQVDALKAPSPSPPAGHMARHEAAHAKALRDARGSHGIPPPCPDRSCADAMRSEADTSDQGRGDVQDAWRSSTMPGLTLADQAAWFDGYRAGRKAEKEKGDA